MAKTILITGASKGIGRSIGVALHKAGHTVIGTSRRPRAEDAPFRLLALDVTDDARTLPKLLCVVRSQCH